MEEKTHDDASAHNGHDTTPERVLFVAFARSEKGIVKIYWTVPDRQIETSVVLANPSLDCRQHGG
jgi:hypothetical protein